MKDTILFGDCRETIPTITEPVRMCVTSPPYYGLRDYGGEDKQIGQEGSPEEFIDQLVEVFKKVRDVLTDDGTLWVNMGDTYYNYRSDGNYPKQTVSKTNQDLPSFSPARGNKLQGLKSKDLIVYLGCWHSHYAKMDGILGKILFGINQIQCPKV